MRMGKKQCLCEWCERTDVNKKGYCNAHATQLRVWGEIRRCRRDRNTYEIKDGYAEIILTDINLEEKARAIIDIDDVERCKPYKWVIRGDGYVSAKIEGKGVKLHRFINKTPKGKHTDHLNRDRLDNRKSNLKTLEQNDNNKNKGKYKSNKTGKTGVLLHGGRYYASMKYNKINYKLGSFDNFEDAKKAREEAEIKFYGYIKE